jgi:hypothetical protein
MYASPTWASMTRAAARPADRKPLPSPHRRAGARTTVPKRLTKAELELGDGRYLLAYGYGPAKPADA